LDKVGKRKTTVVQLVGSNGTLYEETKDLPTIPVSRAVKKCQFNDSRCNVSCPTTCTGIGAVFGAAGNGNSTYATTVGTPLDCANVMKDYRA
jgi:hypothetical protein